MLVSCQILNKEAEGLRTAVCHVTVDNNDLWNLSWGFGTLMDSWDFSVVSILQRLHSVETCGATKKVKKLQVQSLD